MDKRIVMVAFTLAGLLGCAIAGTRVTACSNQLPLASSAPVVYGHHHLNVTSIDEHKKFWMDGLGGVVATLEWLPATIIRFPDVSRASLCRSRGLIPRTTRGSGGSLCTGANSSR
jgi:hypothetical protein